MARIELANVQKFFGSVQVLKDVNLTIEDGEFVVMLGQSGCGKTTTLRAIAGLETVSSGTITIDGREVQDLKAGDRDIAFVFQSFSLYPHMTVEENIAFPLRAVSSSRASPAWSYTTSKTSDFCVASGRRSRNARMRWKPSCAASVVRAAT